MSSYKALINSLDTPTTRILIKAKIVIIDEHSLKNLGASILDSPPSQSTVGFSFPLLKFANQQLLNLKLNALETSGNAKIISSPHLVVNNNNAANIASGEEIPYQERSRHGNTNITFKKALLELRVTPHLHGDNRITLTLSLHQPQPGVSVKKMSSVSSLIADICKGSIT